MRASRLVSIILLLQARGRLTAAQLAQELEVSVRTVYRDVESLHAAGIPLYGDAGHRGGYQLMDGYRTRLTGLSPDEAKALSLSGLPGPAAELGLGPVLATAELKVRAALPPALAEQLGATAERFHLDATGWYARTEDTPFLPAAAARQAGPAAAALAATGITEPDGWIRAILPIESIELATGAFLTPDIEVLEPAELRASIAATARAIATIYQLSETALIRGVRGSPFPGGAPVMIWDFTTPGHFYAPVLSPCSLLWVPTPTGPRATRNRTPPRRRPTRRQDRSGPSRLLSKPP